MIHSKQTGLSLKIKNIFFLIIILFIQKSNSNTNKISDDNIISESDAYKKINRIQTTVILDKKSESCDLNVSEKVIFSFDQPTDTINHMIISKKFTHYGFGTKIVSDDKNKIKILKQNIYSHPNLRKLLHNYISLNDNSKNFKENWLLSITLSEPVQIIELDFTYNIQMGLYIDPINKINIFQYELINPYVYSIENFKIEIIVKNYELLNKNNLTIPQQGIIEDLEDKNGIKLTMNLKLPDKSLYSVNLPLPYEIEICNIAFTKIVSFIIYSITFILTLIGMLACLKIGKE